MDPQWNQKQEICYISMQKQPHVNLSVRETAFHIRVDYPFLGASLIALFHVIAMIRDF